MSRLKAILGVCFIFFLGAVTGITAGAKFMELRIRAAIEGGPDAISALIVRRLDRKLGFDPDQRREVREIIDHARGEIRQVRREADPAIAKILVDAETAIRATLDPEQAREFEEIRQQARERWGFPGERASLPALRGSLDRRHGTGE